MTRTVPSGLQTHLDGTTTSTATLWTITRQDAVVLRFTDHDRDIVFGGDTYKAAVGYQRTDINSSATLSVDSLDVSGILNSKEISESDLRVGRYDYAEVTISMVNWIYPDGDGIVGLRRGFFGEIIFDENSGTFSTELRGLSQVFSQNIIEQYGRLCRYDLGDGRCNKDNNTAILPPVIANNTAYAVGDVVRVREAFDDVATLHAPGVIDNDDDSQFAAVGTTGSEAAAADTNKLKNLVGNFRFQPAGGPTQNPSNSFIS